jgi:Rrf2 family nitric oxide-sensitive transcriptional repressor
VCLCWIGIAKRVDKGLRCRRRHRGQDSQGFSPDAGNRRQSDRYSEIQPFHLSTPAPGHAYMLWYGEKVLVITAGRDGGVISGAIRHPVIWYLQCRILAPIFGIENAEYENPMRLASYTDYGLRVMMRLAGTPDLAVSTGQIATEFDISQHHLAKVVRDLGRGGFIVSQRGRSGGLRLVRPANTITMGEVVRHLEARFAMVDCFRDDGRGCLLSPRCRMKRHLAAAEQAFLRELDRTTIEDCAWDSDDPPAFSLPEPEPCTGDQT